MTRALALEFEKNLLDFPNAKQRAFYGELIIEHQLPGQHLRRIEVIVDVPGL